MKHGSLFTGVLGFDLGFEDAGIETVWHSEVDRFCNRVIKHRTKGVPNLGDVQQIDGRRIEPVDVISFGSPCQDLSVAGRRAGLGGARSHLFFEAARVINECRPAFAVWENVPGAFSSDAGRDLWTVLYTLRELGANDVAWRVFDSQYAGVPQQRKRIYLVADFRGRRAGEILFDPEGCSGHPSPFGQSGQELASTLAAGAYRSGRPGGSHDTDLILAPAVTASSRKGDRPSSSPDSLVIARALNAHSSGNRQDGTVDTYVIQDARDLANKDQNGDGVRRSDVAYTLDGTSAQAVYSIHPDVLHRDGISRNAGADAEGRVRKRDSGNGIREGVSHTLNTGEPPTVAYTFQPRIGRNGRGGPSELARPLTSQAGSTGRGDSAQYVFDPSQITNPDNRTQLRRAGDQPSHTLPAEGSPPMMITQRGRHDGQHDDIRDDGLANALTSPNGGGRTNNRTVFTGARVRRFTPVECERLQGFPDGWTCLCGAEGDIWSCKCPDGPRYRALGNAATRTVPRWIGQRFREILG